MDQAAPQDESFVTERRQVQGSWLPHATQAIHGVESMAPFFMSVASPSNHWLFLSSLGSLTAGRERIEKSLFPYGPVDQIHDAAGKVGGRTLVRRPSDGAVWEPFTERSAGLPGVARSIVRSAWGTTVTLVERYDAFGLEVRQTWTTSDERGLLRFLEIKAVGDAAVEVDILDGVVDLLPASVDPGMQARLSSLVAAYRMAELSGDVGVFTLGSIPIDRATPSEALLGTTAWCTAEGTVVLSETQIPAFRSTGSVTGEPRSRGVRGAFMVARSLRLEAGASDKSAMAFEVEQAADQVEALQRWLGAHADPLAELVREAAETEVALASLLGGADAMQHTGSFAEDARHYANTLYNVMRGGYPVAPIEDVEPGPGVDADEFRHRIESLPLGFSRRHGDPSRPWNAFTIDVRDENGDLKTGYEGNWRDIFQNWEALGVSYPRLLRAFIVRFLNASTADGYNPYRVDSVRGVDWEVEDPDDPWSHIGYWGDHQIVYLTRLLERMVERFPAELDGFFGEHLFVHAEVPYRIGSLEQLIASPRDTVEFDHDAAERIAKREAKMAVKDARLLHDGGGELVRATLEEKLLVPFLVKLSNFIPGAGVWMNTQRPEWNDANNALAGTGASIVTTAALLGHGRLLGSLLGSRELTMTERSRDLLQGVGAALAAMSDPVAAASDPSERARFLGLAGGAGERHRAAVYGHSGLAAVRVAGAELEALLEQAHGALAATLESCRRDDGLFHTYNLVSVTPGKVEMRRLPLMLEGQAATLGSGFLTPEESLTLLESLRGSDLYRGDLDTYLLYPDRDLPGLLERGLMPDGAPPAGPLVEALVAAGDRSVVRAGAPGQDGHGPLRFAPALRSVEDLHRALDQLGPDFTSLVKSHRQELADGYLDVFQHAAFTGRSGSFFGYEGLGCTYWHMISKLALAVQETLLRAKDSGAAPGVISALSARYREIRRGIGVHRSPREYGAFPTEPYSHSPGDGLVRQPGMTGQVKEDLLARVAEVSLRVRDGRIQFDPTCVIEAEFAGEPGFLPRAEGGSIPVPASSFAFTHCGVPVIVTRSAAASLRVELADGGSQTLEDPSALTAELSQEIFHRSGKVAAIHVGLKVE